MRHTERQEITHTNHVTVDVECDICHERAGEPHPDGWHRAATGHGDWGNDSHESIEDWDVCSPKCYFELVARHAKSSHAHTGTLDGDMSVRFAARVVEFLAKGDEDAS